MVVEKGDDERNKGKIMERMGEQNTSALNGTNIHSVFLFLV